VNWGEWAPYPNLHLLSALRASGFPLRHMLIWGKNHHVLGALRLQLPARTGDLGWVEGAHRFYGKAGETFAVAD